MAGYTSDTRGLATINVINPKCLAHLKECGRVEFELAVKAGFEAQKNSQVESNDLTTKYLVFDKFIAFWEIFALTDVSFKI